MNKQNKKIKLFYGILIFLSLLLLVWLGFKNFPFGGQFQIDMKLNHDTSLITKLGPPPRVEMALDIEKIYESPVYFDVRILPWYKKAQVHLGYQEDGQNLEGMGGQTAAGFNYHVINPTVKQNLEDDWQEAVFDFNLSTVYQENNFYRFLISTTPEDDDIRGEMRIRDLKIILFK